MARLLQFAGSHYLASGAGYYAAAPPSLALSVVSTDWSEGATITFRVTASKLWDETVTVAYATSNGTGSAGVDYTAASGTALIPPGNTTADIDVVTLDRGGVQASRTFTLTLSAPTTTSGDVPALTTPAQTVTIADTDVALPIPHLVVSVVGSPPEEGQPFTFRVATVDLVPTPEAIAFQYETVDGTAVSGVDYTPTSGNTSILAGASSRDFTVQTIARDGYQGPRTVQFSVVSANTTVTTPTVTGTILDNEVPAGENGYYEALIALPQKQQSWSLRQAQDIVDLSEAGNPYFTYDPASDTYHTPQDATKWTLAQDLLGASVPGSYQLRFPMTPKHDSGTLLLTWDVFYTREMFTNRGGVTNYKMFQLLMNGSSQWTNVVTLSRGSDALGYVGSSNDSPRTAMETGYIHPAMFRREPLTNSGPGAVTQHPDSGQFNVAFGKWTRYWWEIKLNVPYTEFPEWEAEYAAQYGAMFPNPKTQSAGAWNMMSLWIADEDRDPVRQVYRAPLWGGGSTTDWINSFNLFRFEMNTSQSQAVRTGDMIAYFRNVVFLKNYDLPAVSPESDTFIFQRPE